MLTRPLRAIALLGAGALLGPLACDDPSTLPTAPPETDAPALQVVPGSDRLLYVNNNGAPNSISGFIVDANGTLTPIPGAPFPTGGAGGVCFDIGSVTDIRIVGDFLYATNSGSNSVSGFHINADGSLTPVPGSPFSTPGFNPVGVAASSDGKFLFVGLFGSSAVAAYQINADGSLTLVPGSPFVHPGSGFDVIFDATRKNVISNVNGNVVSVFDVAPNGALTPIPGSPFRTPTTNNHKMALRPPGDECLYVAGGGDPRASIMEVAPDGSLSNAPGSPVTVGEGIVGTAVTPHGAFVYFGSFTTPHIFGFSTDATCRAIPIGGSPFASGGQAPTGLTTDDKGEFLFAVNTFSGSVSSLRIDGSGALQVVDTKPLQGTFSCPVGIVFTFPGKGQQVGPPATLELEPPAAVNTVDSRHCVTATVRDAAGNPVPDILVRFEVRGAVNTSGEARTDENGQAVFCYQGPPLPGADVITAFADTDEDGMQDADEPGNRATKTWVLPPTTPGCEIIINDGGRITAANGDKATFGGNAKSSETGATQGEEEYQDHGPAQPLNMHSINVLTIVCEGAGDEASIYGDATVDGLGPFSYRIKVRDRGEGAGSADTYWILLGNGYTSGDQVLEGGNVQIRLQN